MDITPTTPLAEFQAQQHALILLCQRLAGVLEGLNMPALYGKVHAVEQRLFAETLKILVVGEHGRGKSTVINALLGEKLLPAYPVPTTALRCEIKWGKQSRAILHYHASHDGSRRRPRNELCPHERSIPAPGRNELHLYITSLSLPIILVSCFTSEQ